MAATTQTILKPTRARGLDTSGNNNHAQIYSGRGLEFDGVLDYLDGPSFTDIGVTGDVTVSFWGKYNAGSGVGMFWGIYAALTDGMGVVIDRANNTLEIFDDSSGTDIANIYATTMNPNTWYRIVFVLDNSEFKLYMNGVLVGSGTNVQTHWSGNWTPDIFLGIRSGAIIDQSYSYILDGAMSDFQVWDKVWTAADAEYDYLNPEQLALNRGGTSLTNSNLKLWYPMNEGHRGNQSYILDASNTGLGDNIVTNGTFDTDTHWHKGGWGGISISDGKLRWDGTQTNWAAAQNNQDGASNTTVSGQTYRAKFDWTRSASTLQFKTGGSHLNISSGTSGSADFNFIANGSYWYFTGNSDMIATVDNVEVYPINAKNNATTKFYGDNLLPGVSGAALGDFEDSGNTPTFTVKYSGGSGSGGTYDADNTSSPLNGSKDGKFTNAAGENAGLVSNALDVVTGRTYEVSFKYKTNYDASSQTSKLRYKLGKTQATDSSHIDNGGGYDANDNLIATTSTTFTDTFTHTDTDLEIFLVLFGDNGLVFQIDDVSFKEVGTASGWTNADQQLDIPQTALQSYNQLAYTTQITSSTQQLYADDYAPNFGTDNFTVCFSLFTDANSGSNIRFMYMKTGSGRFILRQKYDETLEIYLDDGTNNTEWSAITSSNAMHLGEWTHYTVVVTRGSVDTVKTYINGEYEGTSLSISSITGNINAGGDFYPMGFDSTSLQMQGSIDEIAIFKGVALSLDEIEELYNNGTPLDALTHSQSSNLNAYWRNNGLGSWPDLTGTNNPIVPQSNCTETMLITAGADSSRDSQGFLMNRQRTTNCINSINDNSSNSVGGNTEGVVVQHSDTLNISGNFTLCAWVKFKDLDYSYNIIHKKVEWDAPGYGLYRNTNGNMYLEYNDGVEDDGGSKQLGISFTPTLGKWYFVFATHTNSGNDVRGYALNTATTLTSSSSSGALSSVATNTVELTVGTGISGTDNNHNIQFSGQIDDVQVYNKALSADELLRNFKAGKRSHK